ncbi:MAG: ATP-grasp domain-containing protein [Bradymonadales bacterium]|nr:MAG: ATP-grasp domain-containing protein [Bradymonadales bacterium]
MSRRRLGILGDGQLAKMLAEAALEMEIEAKIFSVNQESSAQRSGLWAESDLRKLGEWSDRIVIESEFASFEEVSSDKLFPNKQALSLLRNKLEQKRLCERLKIPTSPFEEIEATTNLKTLSNETFVFKWAEGGYDGKGTLISPSEKVLQEFCEVAFRNRTQVYREERIKFVRELALVSLRSGPDYVFYPLVISEQREGVCHRVFGPAQAFGLSAALQSQAESFARKLSESTGLKGCFAIEFFLLEGGELLLNEIAPRVHNSGHWTQLLGLSSQFHQHLRACFGEPLLGISGPRPFGMLNNLGRSLSIRRDELPPWAQYIDYKKSELRVRRKMGHFNFWLDELSGLEEGFSELEEILNQGERSNGQ